jgi:hypothetical protein
MNSHQARKARRKKEREEHKRLNPPEETPVEFEQFERRFDETDRRGMLE